MTLANWQVFRHFTAEEFTCACCGVERMEHEFMQSMDNLREEAGHAIIITSGYRCPKYDAKIGGKGNHSTGKAADIQVAQHRWRDLIPKLYQRFNGVGLKMRGDYRKRFAHVDTLGRRTWSY